MVIRGKDIALWGNITKLGIGFVVGIIVYAWLAGSTVTEMKKDISYLQKIIPIVEQVNERTIRTEEGQKRLEQKIDSHIKTENNFARKREFLNPNDY